MVDDMVTTAFGCSEITEYFQKVCDAGVHDEEDMFIPEHPIDR